MSEGQIEHEGWRAIALHTGKAIGQSVSTRTAQRYADPDWPTTADPHPLPLGQRGNGVRFLCCNPEFYAWVKWFKGKPGVRVRPLPEGDRRRGPQAKTA